MKTPRQALEVTQRYWTEVPVRVFELASELGLGPHFDDRLPPNISGKIVREGDDNWKIYVNAKHTKARQRFTVAHEIAHFIYHRNLLAHGVSDTLAYRADDEICPNPQIQRQEEWQANNFAANLLIPDRQLPVSRSSKISSDEVKALADRFEVSEAAMRIKLGLPIPDASVID